MTNANIIIDRPQKPLLGKILITSDLVAETGLHIGGGAETLDIGGVDKPVIRDPLSNQPYLPGSSLKGKLRSILERIHNKQLNRSGAGVSRYESDDLLDGYTAINKKVDSPTIPYEGARTCVISRVFGSTGGGNCLVKETDAIREELEFKADESRTINGHKYVRIKGRNAPARLIVRDCHLETVSANQLKQIDTGLYMTEWKFENSIDRVTAAANPRQFERVPMGAKFKFELIYTVENMEQTQEDLQNLAIALAILEDDALGGHGSRGYGKIKFSNFHLNYRSLDYYRQIVAGSSPESSLANNITDTTDLLSRLDNNNWQRMLPGASNG
jgi:CRISPR-associated protein Csm3